jgi:hypothetical protein
MAVDMLPEEYQLFVAMLKYVEASGRSTFNARRTKPFEALKTTALAPIATARVSTATIVNPEFIFSMRIPNRKYCQSVCMATSPEFK